MWLNLLISLGACVALFVFGLFVYWIIINIKKTLRTNQSNSMKRERQTPLTITEDINDLSLEQPLYEADYAPDIQRETDTKAEDDDWLNNGVPAASASTIKKEDDDWLNAENNQLLETVDDSSLNRATTNRPEIQIMQDGSILLSQLLKNRI